ncbi:MAG TPA: histidine kinase, partial [Flavobacteriales bacterium]|nr:histidine kinase [Flavobacteriales bacterium]
QQATASGTFGLFVDREGAAWWCDGSDRLYRADPSILFVPEHEGLDLRAITALCTDSADRIWFATAKGVFRHAAAFSEELHVTRIPLDLDPRTPIVSLCATADGTVWAASFGSGVFSISPDGHVKRYTTADGLSNNNVLSARPMKNDVWFGTLEGLSRWRDGRMTALAPEAGFVFDVLPQPDGNALMATDGHGVMRWDTALASLSADGPRTFYTLVRDAAGNAWSAGPGTGLCRITGADTRARCVGQGRMPFDDDLYAVANGLGRLVAFGSTGVAAYDPITGAWTDLAAHFGLQDMQAQLNVIATDATGSIWIGCNKGLVRIRPTDHHFDPEVPVVITGVLVDGAAVPIDDEIRTTHDRNDVTIRFTGLYYTDPAALRFEYRMAGPNGTILRTRDREATFSGLPAGTHHFQVRAFVGVPAGNDPWHTLMIVVEPPWWRLPWVIVLAGLLLTVLLVLIVRARDRRVRFRERMEKEQVRFQLETLRSQVDPHFLFNSFNTLVELIEDQPSKAVEHVDQLSTFFRNILLVRDKDLHTVGEELDLLETYFALEQRRFGEAIVLRVEVEQVHRRDRIVPLTLQLLVENALKHNVATLEAPLVIRIEAALDALVVSNPIAPRLSPPRSTGFGLESILKRYAAFTDRPIEVTRHDGVFRVRIPLIAPMP